MTTIVYSNDVLCADTLGWMMAGTYGQYYKATPKLRLSSDNTFVWGSTGVADHPDIVLALEQLLRLKLMNYESLTPAETFDSTFSKSFRKDTIIMTRKAAYTIVDGSFRPITEGFFSIGSGSRFATVALCEGMSAIKAVEFAVELDMLSGGELTIFKRSSLKPFKVIKG